MYVHDFFEKLVCVDYKALAWLRRQTNSYIYACPVKFSRGWQDCRLILN